MIVRPLPTLTLFSFFCSATICIPVYLIFKKQKRLLIDFQNHTLINNIAIEYQYKAYVLYLRYTII